MNKKTITDKLNKFMDSKEYPYIKFILKFVITSAKISLTKRNKEK